MVYKKNTDELKVQEDFITELKKLNCMILMVSAGATGYVQVCNRFTNRKIKEVISEREEIYYDQYEDQWRAGKFTVSDRCVLLAQ